MCASVEISHLWKKITQMTCHFYVYAQRNEQGEVKLCRSCNWIFLLLKECVVRVRLCLSGFKLKIYLFLKQFKANDEIRHSRLKLTVVTSLMFYWWLFWTIFNCHVRVDIWSGLMFTFADTSSRLHGKSHMLRQILTTQAWYKNINSQNLSMLFKKMSIF